VVKQLYMPGGYRPEKFSNPALQWHYRILQAIALDEELPEKPDDHTLPKYRLIRKHAMDHVLKWGEELEGAWGGYEGQGTEAKQSETGRGRKRAADDEENEGVKAPPKKKAASSGDGPKDEDMRKAYDMGQVNKFTVAQLKAWLTSKRLEAGGRKADLVERVEGWLDRHS